MTNAVEALKHYAEQYCEGWCKDCPPEANFDDCGGCRARLALQSEDPSRIDLIESLQQARSMLQALKSAHFDDDEDSAKIDDLNALEHHLLGSLISSKGEFVIGNAAPSVALTGKDGIDAS